MKIIHFTGQKTKIHRSCAKCGCFVFSEGYMIQDTDKKHILCPECVGEARKRANVVFAQEIRGMLK